ncbi:MAG: DUF3553 domain-containing protein [Phycisphaerae bacterium]
MSELTTPLIVGQAIAAAARPDWGVGVVLRVEPTVVEGRPAQRVTVRFPIGQKVVLTPPARLTAPPESPQRESGWIDQIAGRTLDDRLRALPEHAVQVLGSLRDRLLALKPLYAYDESPGSLVRWARAQTGLGDPLSHYSRDELAQAFEAFSLVRDAVLKELCARARKSDPDALTWLREQVDQPAWNRMASLVR